MTLVFTQLTDWRGIGDDWLEFSPLSLDSHQDLFQSVSGHRVSDLHGIGQGGESLDIVTLASRW